MTATSGFVSSAFWTASFPSPASATTCQFGWASTIWRNPDLTTSWSSAIRIRIMVTAPGVLRRTYRNAPVAPLEQTLMSESLTPDMKCVAYKANPEPVVKGGRFGGRVCAPETVGFAPQGARGGKGLLSNHGKWNQR